MTANGLHPAAAAYLRRLHRAARWLPRPQAAELEEQITAHLADALPVESDTSAADAAIRDLGDPRQLVQDASGTTRRRFRTRLRRVRWWTWTIIGLLLASVTATTIVIMHEIVPFYRAEDLECSCGQQFLYGDEKFARYVQVGSIQAEVLDARPQRQGFEFDVINRTSITQTIIGFPADYTLWGGYQRNYGLSVGTQDEQGFPLQGTRFDLPVAIPPGQNRAIRVNWQIPCFHTAGRQGVLESVKLRVRVGPFTRTESIDLAAQIVLNSTKRC